MNETHMLCPACGGSRTDRMTGLSCQWCEGKREVSPEAAERYADTLARLAMARLIGGHHGEAAAEKMGREAASIRATAGRIRNTGRSNALP
jgi:hypothetical protein